MSGFKDRTYCASPDCNNKCGRAMTDKEKAELYTLTWKNPESQAYMVSYGYFCGEPEKQGVEHD